MKTLAGSEKKVSMQIEHTKSSAKLLLFLYIKSDKNDFFSDEKYFFVAYVHFFL